MKFLTPKEALIWCESRALNVDLSEASYVVGASYTSMSQDRLRIETPKTVSGIFGLAENLLPRWDYVPFKGALLWITQTGMANDYFEEIGSMLLQRMSLKVGYISPFEQGRDERPVLLFGSEDFIEMHSCLVVSLLMGWDVLFVPEDRNYCAFVSHHGIADVVFRPPEDIRDLGQRLGTWIQPG